MRIAPNMTTSARAGDISIRQKKHDVEEYEVRDFKLTGCPSVGACQFLGTAPPCSAWEKPGACPPGSALTPATMHEIYSSARSAGRQIMALVKQNLTPTKSYESAFVNAIIVHAAIGGSTNAALHLPAIAREAGITIDRSFSTKSTIKSPIWGISHPAANI